MILRFAASHPSRFAGERRNGSLWAGTLSLMRPAYACRIAATLILASCLASDAFSQIPIPRIPVERIPGLDRVPGMDKILGKDAPVTTSLADALTEVSYLDDFDPVYPRILPKADDDGRFTLMPGTYSYRAQSYCLKAGTYRPGQGEGYLYAPLKGPKAAIVQSILRRSAAKPQIPQGDVQYLLWAIIARAKLSDMQPKMQRTAAELLTPKELFDLNGGALGLIPEEVKQRALKNVPESVRRIVEAEARIREMMTRTNATFEEIERVAVLVGEPPPEEGDRTDVPRQRWSYHPDGYFVRYDPHGYSTTTVDIYVPDRFDIQRDELQRITRISDSRGNRVELTYSPSRQRDDISSLRASSFASIRLIESLGGEAVTTASWQNTGWTLSGLPGSTSQAAGETLAMTDIAQRVAAARKRQAEFGRLLAPGFNRRRGASSDRSDALAELIDLAHLQDAVTAVAGEQGRTQLALRQSLNLIPMAWQASLRNASREQVTQVASMMAMAGPAQPSSGTQGTIVDPSGSVATPGQTARQRLGQSPRKDCDDGDLCQKLGSAIQSVKNGIKAKRDQGIAAVKGSFKSDLDKALRDIKSHACSDDSLAQGLDDLLDSLNKLDSTPANTAEVVANNSILKGIESGLRRMVEAKCGVSPPPDEPCPITELDALSADAEKEEKNPHDESKLTHDMKDALACLRGAWNPGHTDVSVTSAYRSKEYQRHLFNLWKKYVALLASRNPNCDALREEIEQEMKKHGVIGQPLNPDASSAPQHPQGKAVDVKIPGAPNTQGFLDAAACCNLYRPWPNDPVHFEVCKPEMNCKEGCDE